MYRKLIILIIAILLPNVARAGDYPALSQSWQAERDAACVQVVRLWLSGAPEPILNKEILRFVSREVKLSVLDPEARLFISDPHFKHQRVPVSLLMILLKENGIDLEPKEFFAGKRFFIVNPKGGKNYATR